MDENRESTRKKILKAGSICFGGAAISCTVRNVSASGALLEVESPAGIPRSFVLVIPSDNVSRPCRIIWASERRIGVRFELQDQGHHPTGEDIQWRVHSNFGWQVHYRCLQPHFVAERLRHVAALRRSIRWPPSILKGCRPIFAATPSREREPAATRRRPPTIFRSQFRPEEPVSCLCISKTSYA